MGCKQSQLSETKTIQNETSYNTDDPKKEIQTEKETGVTLRYKKQTDLQNALTRKSIIPSVLEEKKKEKKVIKKDAKTQELIRNAFLNNEFLNYLVNDENEIMQRIIDVMYSKELEANTFIIKAGDIGSHLYVSAYGSFEVFDTNNKSIKKIGVGETFGELAILYSTTRLASVKVLSPSKVWVLDRSTFHDITTETALQKHEEKMKFLQACLVFQNIPLDNLSKITELVKKEFFKSGTTIIRQGDNADKFYIIKAGTAIITMITDGVEKTMGTLTSGEYFGEIALQKDGEVRKATITALDSGVECLTLDRKSFVEYLGNFNEFKGEKYSKKSTDVIDNTEFAYIKLEDLKLVHKLLSGYKIRTELVQFKTNKKLTFVLKKVSKEAIVNKLIQFEDMIKERDLLTKCNSLFIRKLYRTFQDNRYLYFLVEPCLGGNLWSTLEKKGQFNETTAKFMTACVIEAFEYLHEKEYIYGDLKPENIMIDSKGYLKLVDFTSTKWLPYNKKTWSLVGTPEYLAPEIILNRGYNNAVDIWTLGIFIHELLVGFTPFRSNDPMSTYNKILKGINTVIFSSLISNTTQNLIQRLCHPVSTERLGCSINGIDDIRQHRWYNGFDWTALREGTLPAPLINVTKNNQDIQHLEILEIDEEAPEVNDWNLNF